MTTKELRVALVAGATGDIGRATTARLLESHDRVFAVARSDGSLAEVKNTLGADRVTTISGDLRNEDFLLQVVRIVQKDAGRLDTLVHCQGHTPRLGPAAELESAVFDEVFAINLRSPVLLTRLALPTLRESNGAVVFLGSIAGAHANSMTAAYGASKAALAHFAKVLAHEEGPRVRSNVVSPGWVVSATMSRVLDQFKLDEGAVLGRVPMRRAAQPAEVAEMIHWLTSADAAYVSGATFSIDGGGQP